MNLKALILAGGLGTRLMEIVKEMPKPMAPVDDKPFLEYQIMLLSKFNIKEIVLSIGYKSEIISEYFKDGSKFSINIEYSKESFPLGTGGAIKNALPMLGNEFLVLNGDSIILENLNEFVSFHKNKNADQTILLTRIPESNKNRYGNIIVDKYSKIVKFAEKQETIPSSLINAGIYLIRKDSIDWESTSNPFSFERDLVPDLIHKGNLYGFVSNGFFIDIGIPEDYYKIQSNIDRITEYLNSKF